MSSWRLGLGWSSSSRSSPKKRSDGFRVVSTNVVTQKNEFPKGNTMFYHVYDVFLLQQSFCFGYKNVCWITCLWLFMNLCLSALAFEIVQKKLTKVKCKWNKSSFSPCGFQWFQISGYPMLRQNHVVPYIAGDIQKNTVCPPIGCSYHVYFSSYLLSFSLLDGKTTQHRFHWIPIVDHKILKSNGHGHVDHITVLAISHQISPHYDWFNTNFNHVKSNFCGSNHTYRIPFFSDVCWYFSGKHFSIVLIFKPPFFGPVKSLHPMEKSSDFQASSRGTWGSMSWITGTMRCRFFSPGFR